jgi:hypothetical protein
MPDNLHKRIRLLDVARLVFSAMAIGLILVGLFTMRETSRSRGWLKTGATIVSSRVTEYAGKSGRTYRPMVIYAYSVGPARFMSSRIAFRQSASSSRAAAEGIAARYRAGTRVEIRYDPQDPEQAVLAPGGNFWVWILAGGLCSALAVGARMRRRRIEKRGTR